jgi:hypothetical protein
MQINSRRIFVIFFSSIGLLAFLGVIVIASSPSLSIGMLPGPGPIIVTTSFGIDENTLLLGLRSTLERTVVLNQVIIKNSARHVATTFNIVPTELPWHETRNITINLGNNKLYSGIEYSAIFYTTEGANYSYSFSVPINARITKASLESANTLLLDIQSLSNLYTFIDTLSISELSRRAIPSGQMGYIFMPLLYDYPVATELSAHEKMTIIVNLNNVPLSPGNFTVNFNHANPAHGGGLRFDVTGAEPGLIEMETGLQKVSFDSTDNSTLLLDVHSFWNHTFVVSSVTIKEVSAKIEEVKHIKMVPGEIDCVFVNVFADDIVPTELPAYKDTTVRVNLNNMNLSSGNYTVNFESTNGNSLWAHFAIS